MCTRHPGGHNLTKLIRAASNETTRTERARLGDLAQRDMVHPIERCHKGENGKQATQTCTRHPGGHNLAKLIWAPSNEMAQLERTQLDDLTRPDTTRLTERICHKGANRKWAARTCIRHPGSHKLAKLIQAPSNKTTRLERAQSGDLT